MIIYKDLISGDELFTDTHKMETFKDCFYKVATKTTTETSCRIDESLIGGNKSAEDTVDDTEEAVSDTQIDLVFECKISKIILFGSKKDFLAYIKPYACGSGG